MSCIRRFKPPDGPRFTAESMTAPALPFDRPLTAAYELYK